MPKHDQGFRAESQHWFACSLSFRVEALPHVFAVRLADPLNDASGVVVHESPDHGLPIQLVRLYKSCQHVNPLGGDFWWRSLTHRLSRVSCLALLDLIRRLPIHIVISLACPFLAARLPLLTIA